MGVKRREPSDLVSRPRLRALMCLAGTCVLAACSSGGSVNLGSGQSPDPATVDFPIFYVKRTIPPRNADDLRQLRDAIPDADLYMRDRASPSAPERNITERITGTDLYDVRDVDVSPDGTKVVFAMRGPLSENMNEEDPPTWNIWEYDIATDTLRRVIASDVRAEEGHDVAPHYLPDGRIVFSSTRQRQSRAILLDEGKPAFEALNEDRDEPAFVLHVMTPDGQQIDQISFNPSSDLDPTVLLDGRVLWSRWDHAPGRNGIHLYTANPDGTDLQLHYGANSHQTGTNGQTIQFVDVREMQDGRLLALVRPMQGADFGGDLVIIDAKTYVENTQPTLANQGMSGPAQVRATPNDVRTVPGPSPGGRFNSAYPLWDGTNRILVSWSQCRLLDSESPGTIVPCTSERLADPNVQTAPPLYSVWMFDPAENTLLPVMEPVEGVMVTDIVAAQPRPLPQVILDKVPGLDLDPDLVSEGVGVLSIRSVYDVDGADTAPGGIAAVSDPANPAYAQRPARFIRIEKPVSIPDDDVLDFDNAIFGVTPYMREILAYAPIEPDGSVKIKVPANVPFQISILDRNGRRISPIHRSWLQVRPGEVLECNGCHAPATAQNPRSHGRKGLFASAYAGAAATGVPFPNTNPFFSPDAGETMAETRARLSCSAPVNNEPRCSAMNPSMNLVYIDHWTNPPATDPEIAYTYSDASILVPPTSLACISTWSSLCRIVINYEQHIQPMWDRPRTVDQDQDGVPDVDAMGNPINGTCSQGGCHSTTDAMGTANANVPAAQLDLTGVPSDEQPLHLRSYRELFFQDFEQELVDGVLTDRLVDGPIDPETGVPTQVRVPVSPYLTPGSANAQRSRMFLDTFAPGGLHAGYLTPHELRLLSEWLDIGAQYFNNPFDAPEN